MYNQTQLPVPHDRCHNLNFMNISHHSCVSPFLSLHPAPLILPALPQELEAAIKTIVIWLKSADAALDQHTSYTGPLHHASSPIMPPWPLPSPSPSLPSLSSLDTTTLPVVTMVHPPQNTLANELEKIWAWTHLAYNILSSNVVTKFGAYCTLYCHNKSGAVLFSVRTMMTTNALAWGSKLKGVGPSGSKGLFRSPTRGVTNGSKGWDVGPTGSKGSFSGLSGSGPNGSKGLGVVPSCSQDLLLREANASRYLSLQEAKAVREARLLLDTLFEGLDA